MYKSLEHGRKSHDSVRYKSLSSILKNMRLLKFLVISLIILFPGSNACYYQAHTSVTEVDCAKSALFQKIPGTPDIVTFTSHCKDYRFDIRSMKTALDIFSREYALEFGIAEHEAMALLGGLKIEVSAIPRSVQAAYSVEGELLQGGVPVNGLALDKDSIWVEVKTSSISHSALIHELIHIIIWRQNIVHGDPDHEGKQFSGWSSKHTKLIKRVNSILLDAGI